jgi:thiol-disulfide isomerase/thioredoxin
VAFIVFTVAYLAFGTLKVSRRHTALPAPPLEQGDWGQMAYDWKVSGPQGEVDVSDLQGKVLFVNFWEYWCPPCRAEMPSVDRLQQIVNGQHIVVLPVFTDEAAPSYDYLRAAGLETSVYRAVGEMPAGLQPEQIPTTLIVARDGRIVARHVGAAQWDDDSVVKLLRQLADE